MHLGQIGRRRPQGRLSPLDRSGMTPTPSQCPGYARPILPINTSKLEAILAQNSQRSRSPYSKHPKHTPSLSPSPSPSPYLSHAEQMPPPQNVIPLPPLAPPPAHFPQAKQMPPPQNSVQRPALPPLEPPPVSYTTSRQPLALEEINRLIALLPPSQYPTQLPPLVPPPPAPPHLHNRPISQGSTHFDALPTIAQQPPQPVLREDLEMVNMPPRVIASLSGTKEKLVETFQALLTETRRSRRPTDSLLNTMEDALNHWQSRTAEAYEQLSIFSNSETGDKVSRWNLRQVFINADLLITIRNMMQHLFQVNDTMYLPQNMTTLLNRLSDILTTTSGMR